MGKQNVQCRALNALLCAASTLVELVCSIVDYYDTLLEVKHYHLEV